MKLNQKKLILYIKYSDKIIIQEVCFMDSVKGCVLVDVINAVYGLASINIVTYDSKSVTAM